MAFKRFARALVNENNIEFERWVEEIRNQHEAATSKDYVGRIAKTVLRKCDPKQYLLSHATIVASVDTYAPKGSKTGRQMNRGIQIDVKYPDFRIKPECHEIINNNGDAWERSLLLSTYRTFISAANYLEHIQLPELSKGFIVDAIARDLGKTCYIDILVATDRKHSKLIQDILSGEISAMSMGCISLFTICSRCGNVAVDDSQLCPCVAFDGKHSKFADENGIECPVSELIGHVGVPNSNQFIEASWVRNPAFRGAVRRQILNPDSAAVAARVVESGLAHELRRDEVTINGVKKAASKKVAQQGDEQAPEQQAPTEDDHEEPSLDDANLDPSPSPSPSPSGDDSDSDKPSDSPAKGNDQDEIEALLNHVQEQVMQSLINKFDKKLQPKPEDVGTVAPAPDFEHENGNDNIVNSSNFAEAVRKEFPKSARLVKWATRMHKIVHEGGVKAIRRAGVKPQDLIILSWIEDRVHSRSASEDLYKAAIMVGPLKSFPSDKSFLAACKITLGRNLNPADKKFLMRQGRIASFA